MISSARQSNDTTELSTLKTEWLAEYLDGDTVYYNVHKESTDAAGKEYQSVTESSIYSASGTSSVKFSYSANGGSYSLINTTSNDSTHESSQLSISAALWFIVSGDFTSGAKLACKVDSNSGAVSMIYYQHNVTVAKSSKWACWKISDNTVSSVDATTSDFGFYLEQSIDGNAIKLKSVAIPTV